MYTRVTPEFKDRLRAYANANGLTITQAIHVLCAQGLAAYEKEEEVPQV